MPGQIVLQRRLAHARLTGHDQRPALTGANSIDQPVQHVALAASALSRVLGRRMSCHLPGTDATRPSTGCRDTVPAPIDGILSR
jgi:hypothetical protein